MIVWSNLTLVMVYHIPMGIMGNHDFLSCIELDLVVILRLLNLIVCLDGIDNVFAMVFVSSLHHSFYDYCSDLVGNNLDFFDFLVDV